MTTKEFDAKSLSELYLSADTMIYLMERYIDEQGPVNAIDCIVEVCHEKANHLVANWQDTSTARVWLALAMRLEKVQESAPAETLSNLMR